MNRRSFIHSCLASACAAGTSAGASQLTKPDDKPSGKQLNRPNILFILTDQQFGGAMSCAGCTDVHTPNLDALFRDGIRFDQAYSTNPICVPCRSAIITGHYPHTTGVTYNMESRCPDARRMPSFNSIGKAIQQAGYETGYFGKWHIPVKVEEHPDWHGFDEIHLMENYKAMPDYEGYFDDETTLAANRFLQKSRGQPFFMWVNYNNPHDICEWARKIAGIEDELESNEIPDTLPPLDRLPELPENAGISSPEPSVIRQHQNQPHLRRVYPGREWSERPELWRKHRWGYYRMVELIDQHVGSLIKTLKATGQYDNTVIVFSSDHGDGLGAHQWNQKTLFYEEIARVPFIVVDPARKTPAVVDKETLVNMSIDLFPTLCAYAGIQADAGLPGENLKPVIREAVSLSGRTIVCENDLFEDYEKSLGIEGRMVRQGDYKYCIYNRGDTPEQLFDLKKDPGEMKNLAYEANYTGEVTRFRRILKEWMLENDDPFSQSLL